MSNNIEYEFKFLETEQGALLNLFNFIKDRVEIVRRVPDYVRTNYVDTKYNTIKSIGYSLRHRPINIKNGYSEEWEFKPLGGSYNGISARTETTSEIQSDRPISATYGNLWKNNTLPSTFIAPHYQDVNLKFSTHVFRDELRFYLDTSYGPALVELGYDNTTYLQPSPFISLEDVRDYTERLDNFTPIGFEREFEVEIKYVLQDGKKIQPTPIVVNHISNILKTKFFSHASNAIYSTTTSKGTRGYIRLEESFIHKNSRERLPLQSNAPSGHLIPLRMIGMS